MRIVDIYYLDQQWNMATAQGYMFDVAHLCLLKCHRDRSIHNGQKLPREIGHFGCMLSLGILEIAKNISM